eukprot:gb/GEZJ01004802.1/.p1 GENE.gb/GEZJ01004802.1/~~gb/GEZJ01004802.1/.p1  ORF type:complete len:410 (-),score=27.09 gb/GEZJ01004802.1/:335-1564(-)
MKLHFGDPKKSSSLPRSIAPLVILSRNTSALLYPARSTPTAAAASSCRSVFSQKRASVTGRSSTTSSRRTVSILKSSMMYVVAIVLALGLPLVLPLAMTQVVELVDRTQKWMFDKRIRNRLAADLTSSVMRKQNSDRNVSRTLVMSTRPQGNKSSSGAADGRVVAVSVTEDKTVKQTNNQGAQMGPPTSRPDGAATHPAATFDKARRIVGSAANNTATWTRRRMQPTAMSASALDPSKLARPELARPELARPELDRPELARPELAPPKSDPARDVPRTLANNRSLVALLETRLSNTMTTKVHKWPFARRCATASVTIKLADAVVPAVVEWMQSCANGRLCVVKRYKVNVHELQTHRMQTVRIRLTDDAFIRLSMRCDGSVVRHQWMKLADLRALVGSAADQAAFLQLNR